MQCVPYDLSVIPHTSYTYTNINNSRYRNYPFDQRATPAISKFGKGTSGSHTNSIADLNEDVKDGIESS